MSNLVTQLPARGMITLRGDLTHSDIRKTCEALTGVELPDTRKATMKGDCGLAWMSPDEALIMVAPDATEASLQGLEEGLRDCHHLAVDVSDARVVFRLSSDIARETLARLSPVDLSNQAFGPGDFRRTRLAQVAAAFWMEEDGAICLICFRSVASYVQALLEDAASKDAVGYF